MDIIPIIVKYRGKAIDVQLDLSSDTQALKAQLHSLTNIEPGRQKILAKGRQLHDSTELSKLGLKSGQTLTLLGRPSGDELQATTEGKSTTSDNDRLTQESTQVDAMLIKCRSCERTDYKEAYRWIHWKIHSSAEFTFCMSCFSSHTQPWREFMSLCHIGSMGSGTGNLDLYEEEPAAPNTSSTPGSGLSSKSEALREDGIRNPSISGPAETPPLPDSVMLAPYKYSAIGPKEIRILTLLPATTKGGRNGMITCTLESVSFSRSYSDYVALSYCWGTEQTEHSILIDGAVFKVKENLYRALLVLAEKGYRRLWIDAICIDQINNDEKRCQIPLMGRIYSQTARTVIWLGPGTDDSDYALDCMRRRDANAMKKSKFAMAYLDLIHRQWFYRTWVIQELCLGRLPPKVLCGHAEVDWLQIEAAFMFLQANITSDTFLTDTHEFRTETQETDAKAIILRMIHATDLNIPDLGFARHNVQRLSDQKPRGTLFGALRTCKSFDATNPKDKIYGLLGLLKDDTRREIDIDSSDQKSLAQVYCDSTKHILLKENELCVYLQFAFPGSTGRDLRSWPSWVPDFAAKETAYNAPATIIPAPEYFPWLVRHAFRPLRNALAPDSSEGEIEVMQTPRIHLDVKISDNILHVKGIAIDDIRALAESHITIAPQDLETKLNREPSMPPEEGIDAEMPAADVRQLADALFNATMLEQPPDVQAQMQEDREFVLGLIEKDISNYAENAFLAKSLLDVDQLFRSDRLAKGLPIESEEWITHIWETLIEDFPHEGFFFTADFRQTFHTLVGSSTPSVNLLDVDLAASGSKAMWIAIGSIYTDKRKFFVCKDTEFYGIALSETQPGDQLAFLFPPWYMPFILRPYADGYRMVGPAIIPVHDRFLLIQSLENQRGLSERTIDFKIY